MTSLFIPPREPVIIPAIINAGNVEMRVFKIINSSAAMAISRPQITRELSNWLLPLLPIKKIARPIITSETPLNPGPEKKLPVSFLFSDIIISPVEIEVATPTDAAGVNRLS
uniref:hypothetical protein n=1 Tax=Pluralibacter gergoviae TaxID=61647 RepID=UPI0038790DBA